MITVIPFIAAALAVGSGLAILWIAFYRGKIFIRTEWFYFYRRFLKYKPPKPEKAYRVDRG
jgi:hypothetical protein